MSILISLSPEVEAQLYEKAAHEGQDISVVAVELLTCILEWELQDSEEVFAGIQPSTARRKSKVTHSKVTHSKVLRNGLFRVFKWLLYLRHVVLVWIILRREVPVHFRCLPRNNATRIIYQIHLAKIWESFCDFALKSPLGQTI